jgi:hypothetical protein
MDFIIEQGIGVVQQKTKRTPPNTHYNLPNQPFDSKCFLTKPAILNSFKSYMVGF